MFASTYERLSVYLAEQYAMDHAHSAALAKDLLGRTVLPRLLRTLLNVEGWTTKTPDHTLAEDVDLNASRQVVSTALPG